MLFQRNVLDWLTVAVKHSAQHLNVVAAKPNYLALAVASVRATA